MKKIILSIFTALFGLALFATGAHAASYNTDPQDYGTILVCKQSVCTNNGFGQGGSWSQSVNANAGDIVMVQVYYHNSTGITALNSTLSIYPQSTPLGTTHTFSGGVASTSIARATGSATVYTGTNQTLTFIPGSIRWSPNQTLTPQRISNEASLFATSGFNIGDIISGWSSQGVLTADYQVSNNTVALPPQTVCSLNLTANPSAGAPGSAATLSWTSSNCSNLQLSGYGSVGSSGSTTVYPTSTTTYALTGNSSNGSVVQSSATITVNNIVKICSLNLTANQTSVTSGSAVVLSWTSSNCNNLQLSGYGSVSSTGSTTVYPTSTTTYALSGTSSDGSVVNSSVTVYVNSTVKICSLNLTASQTSVAAGAAVNLSWVSTNCTNMQLSGYGSVGSSGSTTVYPSATTTYTLTGNSSDGTPVQSSVTVNVNSVIKICSLNLTASQNSITSGTAVSLSWVSTNCNGMQLSGYGSVGSTGSTTVYPSATTTYMLNGTSSDGTPVTSSVTVYVNSTVKICSLNLTASQTSVNSGTAVALSWTSTNCNGMQLSGYGTVGSSGSTTVYPSATTTYTLTGNSSDGTPVTSSAIVYVNASVNNSTCSLNLTGSQSSITSGSSVSLSWSSSNCTNMQLSGYGSAGASGSTTVYPSYTTTYTLTGNSTNGSNVQSSYTVYVNSNNNNVCSLNLTGSQSSVTSGNGVTLSWSSSNCTNMQLSNYGSVGASGSTIVYPSATTIYALNGNSVNGGVNVQSTYTVYVNNNNNNNTGNCYVTSFNADQSSVSRGSSTTLRWAGNNLNYVTINGYTYYGNSLMVSPIANTDYNMTAYCSNGASATSYAHVNVNNTASSNIQAITTTATVLGTTGARLNGIAITNDSNSSVTGWFEYGTTASLGQRTTIQNITNGTSVSLSDVVYNLQPDTVYYYRVIVQNSTSSTYGELVRFQTQKGANDNVIIKTIYKTTKAQTVIKTNTVVAESAASLLQLKVTSQFDSMCIDGDMQYTVSYQNLSTQVLKDAVLRVSHPKELTFIASSQGTYSVADRTVTVSLGDIAPGAAGMITLNLKVNSDAVRGNLSVTTATVVYTNTNTRAQEDAIAYSLVTVTDVCPTNLALGASAFGTSFLPHTLIEWLLLILVILALVVLGRQLYKKNTPKV